MGQSFEASSEIEKGDYIMKKGPILCMHMSHEVSICSNRQCQCQVMVLEVVPFVDQMF